MPSKFSLTKKKLQSIWEDTDKRKELDREIQNSKEDIGEIAYISGLIAVGAGALTLLTGGAFAPITIPIMKVGLSIGVIANGTAAGECLNQVGIRLKSDDKWGATKAGGEGALYFLFMASDIEGLKGVSLMKDVAGKGEERVSVICEETVDVIPKKTNQAFKEIRTRYSKNPDMLVEELDKILVDEPWYAESGRGKGGVNQFIRHFFGYNIEKPNRNRDIAKYLGIPTEDFKNNLRGARNFYKASERVVEEAIKKGHIKKWKMDVHIIL